MTKYYSRFWLNEDQGMGAIEVDFRAGSDYLEGSVDIRDCSRAICLDFYCDTQERQVKRLAKLDLIIRELQAAREVLAGAVLPEKATEIPF